MKRRSVVVFGTAGHAMTHLRRARILHDRGLVKLVGACDIREPSEEARALLPPRAVVTSSAEVLIRRVQPDIAIIATPPHTHFDLARLAVAAGCHLLLEKPPVLDLLGLGLLAAEAGDRACQTGFQSFGSAAVPLLRKLVASGELGEIQGIGAAGAWIRPESYFRRSNWAGRRRVEGRTVADGALTNPFAHAVATALLLNGTAEVLPSRTTVELYRARGIEADDTACARISFRDAPDVVVAATLCAELDNEPYVVLHGSRGKARWHYRSDQLIVNGREARLRKPADLLENLVRHLDDPATPLRAPLASTRCFTAFVEAVRDAADPQPIPQHWVRRFGVGGKRRFVVPGIDRNIDTAADQMALFSELGLPWVKLRAYG